MKRQTTEELRKDFATLEANMAGPEYRNEYLSEAQQLLSWCLSGIAREKRGYAPWEEKWLELQKEYDCLMRIYFPLTKFNDRLQGR